MLLYENREDIPTIIIIRRVNNDKIYIKLDNSKDVDLYKRFNKIKNKLKFVELYLIAAILSNKVLSNKLYLNTSNLG